MRGVPASEAITREAVITPYSTAMTPQAMTAQRTDCMIWLTCCFSRHFKPLAADESAPPGARRAENDRTAPAAQHVRWAEIPIASTGWRRHREFHRAHAVAKLPPASHPRGKPIMHAGLDFKRFFPESVPPHPQDYGKLPQARMGDRRR